MSQTKSCHFINEGPALTQSLLYFEVLTQSPGCQSRKMEAQLKIQIQ